MVYNRCLCSQNDKAINRQNGGRMYREDYKVTVPQFKRLEVLLSDCGAISGKLDIETGRHNARVINNKVKELSENGGGTIVIPKGIWASAPIRLLSDVSIRIESQGLLKFIKSKEDYPLIITNYEGQPCIRTVSPITAENAVNVAITGMGIVDGSGDEWRPVKKFKVTDKQWEQLLKKSDNVFETKETQIWMPTKSSLLGNEKNIQSDKDEALEEARDYYDFYRPVMVSLRHCTNVLLSGVTFMNSPAWNIHPFFCENVTIDNIKVRNPYYAQNGDGIDVESCTNVHIHHSVFETGDDAICIKAGKNAIARTIDGPCSNIYIHDCVVNEGHGGFVIGSEMSRGVKDILVENCTFIGTDVGVRMKSALGRGGVVENITIRNIDMVNIKGEAVILTMGYVLNLLNRNETIAMDNEEDVPYFRNIDMDGIVCTDCKEFVKIEPLNGRPDTIKDVVINKQKFC
jgi:polygalacturonase